MELEARSEGWSTLRVGQLSQRWALYWALVVLNALDVLTTMWVLDRGGSESNPFVQPFVHDMVTVSLMKALVLGIVGVLLTRCRESRPIDLALVATTGWYIAVVCWNFTVLAVI
ncbi:MAG: DUF5658 family protein [Actinomycetota bacterium]